MKKSSRGKPRGVVGTFSVVAIGSIIAVSAAAGVTSTMSKKAWLNKQITAMPYQTAGYTPGYVPGYIPGNVPGYSTPGYVPGYGTFRALDPAAFHKERNNWITNILKKWRKGG